MTKAPWSLMPLLLPALTTVAGVMCGTTAWGLLFAATFIVAATVFCFMRRWRMAFALLLGGVSAANTSLRVDTEAPDEYLNVTNTYRGEITQVSIGDNSQTLTLSVTHTGTDSTALKTVHPFKASVTVPSWDREYEPMQTILFIAQFDSSQPLHDLPDEITAADIQRKRGIFMHTVVPEDSIKGIAPTTGWMTWLRRTRSDAARLLLQSGAQPAAKEFLCTALLGDTSQLSKDVRSDFAAAGLAHVLALSGLHVGLIVMLVSFALWPMKVINMGAARTLAIIALLWIYAVFTGLGDSVVRAVVMLSVYLGAKVLQRQSSGYNSLCFAAIVILLADPGALFSIGFQLSFAAVASILLFADALNPINPRRRWAYNAMGLVCVSVSAMMGTALISCIYFHNIPVYFLLANVAVALLLPWLIGGGAILLIAECIGTDPAWLCRSIDFMYGIVVGVAQWVSSLPYSSIGHLYLPAWIMVPYAAALASLKLWLSKRNIWWGSATMALTAIFVVCLFFAPKPTDKATLYVARTTYHTDIVLNNPGERPVLVTTASTADMGAAVYRANRRYADFLGRRGYDSLLSGGHDYAAGTLKWQRPWLDTGNRLLAVVSHDSLLVPPPRNVDYALICRGFRGHMKDVVAVLAPDSIVLCYDLHPKRAKRYMDECDSLGTPYRYMRTDGAWSLPLTSSR